MLVFQALTGHAQVSSWIAQMETLAARQPDSAYAQWKGLLQIAVKTGAALDEANCLLHMGNIHLHFGQYKLALEHLLRAEELLRRQQQPDLLAETLNSLGTVNYYNQQRKVAQSLYREALEISRRSRNLAGMATASGNIGKMYEKRHQYDSAMYYQLQALQWAQQQSDKNVLAGIYEHLGSILEDNARYDSAKYYYEQAFFLYRQNFNEVALAEVINNLGDVLRKTGQVPASIQWSKAALEQARQTADLYQQNSALRDLAKAYHLLGVHDSAFLYMEQSREVMQSVYTTETGSQMAILQAYYDFDKKNAAIDRLQAQRKLGTTLTVGTLLILALTFLLGWVYVAKQRLQNRTANELAAQKESNMVARQHLMEMELKNQQLEEANLKQQLEVKSNQLSSHILHLIQKNEVLETVKSGLAAMLKNDKRDQRKELKALLQSIQHHHTRDQYWDEFRSIFDQVHGAFFRQIAVNGAELSPTEMRLLALIKMDISSQDAASLLGITPDSLRVTRYRLKKKLGIDTGASLTSYVKSIDV